MQFPTNTKSSSVLNFILWPSKPSRKNGKFLPLPRPIYYCLCCLFMPWSGIPAAILWRKMTGLSPKQAANCRGPKLTKDADNIRNFPQPCCVWIILRQGITNLITTAFVNMKTAPVNLHYNYTLLCGRTNWCFILVIICTGKYFMSQLRQQR